MSRLWWYGWVRLPWWLARRLLPRREPLRSAAELDWGCARWWPRAEREAAEREAARKTVRGVVRRELVSAMTSDALAQ